MTDFRRKGIPLLWSTIRERALVESFYFNMGDAKYPCVCRRTKLHSENKGQSNRQDVSQGRFLTDS